MNLALALAAEGANVGLLDADICGPSQPQMLGITGRPGVPTARRWNRWRRTAFRRCRLVFDRHRHADGVARPDGYQALEQPPVRHQLADLDYLVIDMPPGTGDIQLTLSQKCR